MKGETKREGRGKDAHTHASKDAHTRTRMHGKNERRVEGIERLVRNHSSGRRE